MASKFEVVLEGQANDIVDTLRSGVDGWVRLENGIAAAQGATAGKLVIGGLKGHEQSQPSEHGHVVVVVTGPLNRDKYPSAFWGSLEGEPGENQTINWAWTAADRDQVSYAAKQIDVAPLADAAMPPRADQAASASGAGDLPWLARAIHAAAPQADADMWAGVLRPHLLASDIASPKRVAALLGQAAAEAGAGFRELAENVLYTRPERLCEIFPSRFPTLVVARQYAGNDRQIACRAYAGKLGNGNEASADGWRYRGSGLLQITGRDAFVAFAKILNAPVEQVADWVRTPDGAAASACWYWQEHRLNRLADAWDLSGITLAVNGSAMLARALRAAASEAALRAVG